MIPAPHLALLTYADGVRAYIIAPLGITVGKKLMSGAPATPEVGSNTSSHQFPVGLPIHNLELTPGRGAQKRFALPAAQPAMSRDEGYAQVKLPSGEIRKINEACHATIGQVVLPSMKMLFWARPVAAVIVASAR